MKNYKIAVAGTGYVGLSLGVLLSQHHQVVAVDIVQAKVDMINNKKSPIQDDYIEKYLAEKDLNLTATLDAKVALESYKMVVLCSAVIQAFCLMYCMTGNVMFDRTFHFYIIAVVMSVYRIGVRVDQGAAGRDPAQTGRTDHADAGGN